MGPRRDLYFSLFDRKSEDTEIAYWTNYALRRMAVIAT